MDEKVSYESISSTMSTTNSSAVTKLLLPPCMVCGNLSSGFHCGAYTCEACKALFKRYPQRKKEYVCATSGNCAIGPDVRCSFCRYQKCVSIGMSKKVIKVGRYTLKRRTEIILELKKLNEKKSKHQQSTIERVSSLFQSHSGQTSSEETSPFDYELLIRTIVQGHDKHVRKFAFPEEETEQLQKCYLEAYNLRLEMFGSLPTLPSEQYEEIYHATGIDVDNRQERYSQLAISLEKQLAEAINFVKTVPGFCDLSLEDRANLVKYARFEVWFLEGFHGYNNELKVIRVQDGGCIHMDECAKYVGLQFTESLFHSAASLKRLNLVHEEFVIVKAVCVLFTDRCELRDPDKVVELQWRMIQCLTYLLEKNHTDEIGLFARIIDKLTEIRELSEMYYKLSRDLQLLPIFQGKPLLLEILAI